MSSLGEINRVVTLSSAASDFTHYAKALMASRFQRREAAAVSDLSAAHSRHTLLGDKDLVPSQYYGQCTKE